MIGHFDSSRFSALHAVPSPALLSSPLFFFLVLPLRAFPSHQFSLRSPSAFRSTPLSCPAAFFLPTAPDFSTRRPLSFRPFAFPRFHPRSPPFSNREMPGPATDRRLCAPVPSKRRFGQTFPSPPPRIALNGGCAPPRALRRPRPSSSAPSSPPLCSFLRLHPRDPDASRPAARPLPFLSPLPDPRPPPLLSCLRLRSPTTRDLSTPPRTCSLARRNRASSPMRPVSGSRPRSVPSEGAGSVRNSRESRAER